MSITKKTQAPVTLNTVKKRSQWGDVLKRLCRNKLALLGMIIVCVVCLSAIFANFIAPYGINDQNPAESLLLPSLKHICGTDKYGRDLFSRLIYGGRISLLVSLMAIAISLSIGGFIGALIGYFGGNIDTVVMRFMDILMAIPGTLLAVCISAMLGSGVWQTAVAISIGGIAPSCRLLRASALTIRGEEYIEASKACGARTVRVVLTHVIPNCLAPVIVETTLRIGGNIMMISGLSFIGLGVQPPTPEWGSLLNAGRSYIRECWNLITFPGIAIFITMFGFNIFGDGLRDALDPKLKT